jgi:uncharacterized protein (DUF302 family)
MRTFLFAALLCTVAMLAGRSVCHADEAAPVAESYFLSTTTDLSFDDATAKLREVLKAEGFAILTEIDLAATFKSKLDADIPPYIILGACAAKFAHAAWQLEPNFGILMPCNAVVTLDDSGRTLILLKNPLLLEEGAGNPQLKSIGEELHPKMERVLAAFAESQS